MEEQKGNSYLSERFGVVFGKVMGMDTSLRRDLGTLSVLIKPVPSAPYRWQLLMCLFLIIRASHTSGEKKHFHE